jgi:hypothetical protein
MADTYVASSSWDAGCDECGSYEVFETEEKARKWADEHACEVPS